MVAGLYGRPAAAGAAAGDREPEGHGPGLAGADPGDAPPEVLFTHRETLAGLTVVPLCAQPLTSFSANVLQFLL